MSESPRLSRIVDRARSHAADAGSASAPRPDPSGSIPETDSVVQDRLRRASARARSEEGRSLGWNDEARPGETLLDSVSRVLSEEMPCALRVDRAIGLAELREEFSALGPDDRLDEITRHLWFRSVPGRIRTHFSPLLDAIGVEEDVDRTEHAC